MNKIAAGALVVLAIAAASGGSYWYGTQRAAAPAPEKGAAGKAASKSGGAVAVVTTRADTIALPQTIATVGSLRSDESVVLRPEVAGRITEILFQEGQRVEKGMPLVRLDPAIAQADVLQARANHTLAKAKYERALDLFARNFISGQARDEARNNFDVAEAALALAQAKLAQLELKAPFSGITGLRLVALGDYVKEGADIVNIEVIDPLKVDFRVPETFVSLVRVGQPVEVTLDALPGKTYEGRVIALNPLVDAAGRALVVRAQVRNQDATLRPGMFARVNLITRAQKDALVLPEEALVPQGTEQYVFRVVAGRAERVKVETGLRRDGKVEIVSGISSGDTVVISGQIRLRDGVAVRSAGGEAPGDKPAAAPPPRRTPQS